MGANPHCDLVPAVMTTETWGTRLRTSGAKLEDEDMDPMAMLIVALAVILALNVVDEAPRTDGRSQN